MPTQIALALVSHTNVGKTTLARTLLGQDVGEVRDAPHVTEFAEQHLLLQTPEGDRLLLWDTPGFGDSARLARRLQQSKQPIGWFLAQVWDRFTDRPFWSSQQALRAVRDEADVVLYLVNAAESPASAGYVAPEMDLLAWVGQPVIVLLNQLGAPRPADEEAAECERWRAFLGPRAQAVLPLDAFARCWVQEEVLLLQLQQVLQGEPRAALQRLHAAWQAASQARLQQAMQQLADSLARVAGDREPVPDSGMLRDTARRVGQWLRLPSSDDPATLAQQALATRLEEELRRSTAALVALHGLKGDAEREVLARIATPLRRAAAGRRRAGRGAGWSGHRRAGRAEGRHRQRRPDAGWRPAGRWPDRRTGRGRCGPGHQPRARRRLGGLERGRARGAGGGGAAALPGGGAFRPRAW